MIKDKLSNPGTQKIMHGLLSLYIAMVHSLSEVFIFLYGTVSFVRINKA